MIHTSNSFFTLLIFFTFLSCAVKPADPKTDMEANYKQLVAALHAKDADALKSAMSKVAYAKMKNAMLSAQAPFPETLFESVSEFDFDFSKLRFLKAFENGPTGSLVYYDVADDHTVTIKFIKETSSWKFLSLATLGKEGFAEKVKANDLSFLEEGDFQPDGHLPEVEKELTHVDYLAMLDINADFKVTMTVNGVEQEPTHGGSKSGILIGGVKKGENTMEIKLNPAAGMSGGSLSVTIRASINDGQTEVFKLTEATPASRIKKTFIVN